MRKLVPTAALPTLHRGRVRGLIIRTLAYPIFEIHPVTSVSPDWYFFVLNRNAHQLPSMT
jgi:hypothetical protein